MKFSNATTEEFFRKRAPWSRRKTEIIVTFFKGWATIMQRTAQRLLYIDLYAGPGTYDEGEEGGQPVASTPLLILEAAIADVRFRLSIMSLFNDANAEHIARLKSEIDALPGIATLKFAPQLTVGQVDGRIAEYFNKQTLPPTFLFLDPFGYAGLTQALIKSVLKDWGCDIAFFFNYRRLNMAFGTDAFDSHLHALFGAERSASMREKLATLEDVDEREEYVMENLRAAMTDIGGKFSITYRFRDQDLRATHHIAFVSKAYRGYDVMKNTMAKFSEKTDEHIPTFEFIAPTDSPQAGLFAVAPPRRFPWSIDKLAKEIQRDYCGREIVFQTLYDEHNVGRPYVERNYRAALLPLIAAGRISAAGPGGATLRKNACPLTTVLKFNR